MVEKKRYQLKPEQPTVQGFQPTAVEANHNLANLSRVTFVAEKKKPRLNRYQSRSPSQ